ncbi:MAG: sialidase, partial [Gemmatimonadetes bacterium]|nr:sialidase [Gemmatimonadota bacterium]
PVHWLTIQDHFNDLVVSTYGRGFWILDDITPLQQLTEEILDAPAHLFEPRSAYRFRNKEGLVSQPEDPGAGQNPRFGASIHYLIGDAVRGGASMSILDESGDVVQDLGRVSDEPGFHRVYWDLRYESSSSPRMRTKVLEHSHVQVGEDGWRPAGDGGRVTPLAPPGHYTVRLTAGDEEVTVSLTVLKDPSSAGSEADIRAQFDVVMQLRDETNAVVDLINEAERIRAQLVDLKDLVRNHERADEIMASAGSLDMALVALEMGLTDLRLSGGSAGQDALRWPRQLLAKLTSLAGYIGSSDFPPTVQQLEVHERLKGLMMEKEARMESIREGELAALNRMLDGMGVPNIISGGGV